MQTTLSAAIESYLRMHPRSRGTRNEYQSTLRKWEQWGRGGPIEDLQRKDIRDFLDWVYQRALEDQGTNPSAQLDDDHRRRGNDRVHAEASIDRRQTIDREEGVHTRAPLDPPTIAACSLSHQHHQNGGRAWIRCRSPPWQSERVDLRTHAIVDVKEHT
jgi:hypothetical protein